MLLHYKHYAVVLLSLTLASCVTTDDEQRPDINYAESYQSGDIQKSEVKNASEIDKVWWQAFNAPTLNDLMLAGTLCGVEMGLSLAGIPFSKGGVTAALDFLSGR